MIKCIDENAATMMPATHQNCTLGGMIGNNSCGATAQRTGKVVDNIASLDVLLYDGTRMTVGTTPDDELEAIIRGGGRRGEIYAKLKALRALGVPYSDEELQGARKALEGKTEMDALIAYLQGLGTAVKRGN